MKPDFIPLENKERPSWAWILSNQLVVVSRARSANEAADELRLLAAMQRAAESANLRA